MRLTLVLVSLVLFGCGTKRLYEGPARSADEVARLKSYGPRTGWPEAYGEVVRCEGGGLDSVLATEMEMLPGDYRCSAKCHVGDRVTDPKVVTFRALAGRLYQPEVTASGLGCSVQIKDAGPIGGE